MKPKSVKVNLVRSEFEQGIRGQPLDITIYAHSFLLNNMVKMRGRRKKLKPKKQSKEKSRHQMDSQQPIRLQR